MKSNDGLARKSHPHAPTGGSSDASAPRQSRGKTLLKAILGAALIYYVVTSGMIDFSALRDLLLNPANLVVALLYLTFASTVMSVRWFLLARAQGLRLTIKSTFEMTMIGNFFNTFMPGSVGGDLIRAWYVAGTSPKRKTHAVFTVILDRAIGLSVFFIFSGTTLLFFRTWLDQKPELKTIAFAVWGFSLAAIVGAAVFFHPAVWRMGWFNRLLALSHKVAPLGRLVDAVASYRHHVGTVGLAVAISFGSIFVMTLFYKWMGDALGIPLDLPHYFFAIPLALVASAVPILPGGLGVGQVAFNTMFLWMGMKSGSQGGTLCTAVQAYTMLFNCFGAFFYLRFKHHAHGDLAHVPVS